MSEQEGRGDFSHASGLRASGLSDTLDRILREVENLPEGESVPTADDRPPSLPAEGRDIPSDDAPASVEAGNPLGALLGGLGSNPALLSAIPTLMENLGPLLGGGGTGKSGGGSKGGSSRSIAPSLDRHTALLCAVKPYLGSGRQEAAEKIIRLCRAWDALQKSGMTDLLRGFVHAPQTAGEPKGRGGQDSYV